MTARGRAERWSVRLGALLVGVSIAHSLEDFVYGVPARFGLSVELAAVLLGLYYVGQTLLIALAARGNPFGYLGNGVAGIVWLVAAALDHLGEVLFDWPYRAGLSSKAFEVALMLVAIALAVVSFAAWREAATSHSSRGLSQS